MLSRRNFVRGLAMAGAGTILRPLPRLSARPLGRFTPIRRGVGTFTSTRGGTIGWLIRPEALAVVDTQYPDSAAECLAGLKERTSRPLDLLANTHHHGDHTGGNPVFAEATPDHFVAHAASVVNQRSAAEAAGRADSQAYPTDTYEGGPMTIDLGDEQIRFSHYGNGHTSGDSVIQFVNADVVHMGDLVFNRMPPFIDKRAGASVQGWIEILEAVHADHTDDTVFIHGHAGPNYTATGTREDLLVMRDFLSGLLDYVSSGIAAGQGPEEMKVDRLPDFPEYYLDSWETAIPNAIQATHQELSQQD